VAKTFGRLRSNPVVDASEAWVPADRLRIFWFIQTYRDLSRLCSTLDRLRRLYPESSVLVVSDGDPDPGIERACDEHSVGFVAGSRLFGVEHGGEPVQRMLEAFLATDTDILIKIDPDTDLRRRFARLPARHACSVYGSVQSAGPEANSLSSIQGGCIIIPREAALRVASSALLRSERLKPPALEWAVGEMSIARAASGLTSYDWTLGWACRELGLLSKDHPEVFSRYLPSLVDTITARRISVSHPRFEIRQILNPVFYFSGVRAAVREIMGPSDVSRTGQLTPPRSKTV
jgi:hypothetical protein